MEFEEYLIQKKINEKAFSEGDSLRYQEFKSLFGQMHPNSFTAQKLFLINEIRRKFPIGEGKQKLAEPTKKTRPKPKMAIPKKK